MYDIAHITKSTVYNNFLLYDFSQRYLSNKIKANCPHTNISIIGVENHHCTAAEKEIIIDPITETNLFLLVIIIHNSNDTKIKAANLPYHHNESPKSMDKRYPILNIFPKDNISSTGIFISENISVFVPLTISL
ncbi:hypothetical protein D3C72_1652780 [compost metagenome]